MNNITVLTLEVSNRYTMPKVMQCLHSIFAKNKTKVGFNNLALSFPNYSEDSVGLVIDVVSNAKSIEFLKTNYTLMGMCAVNNVKVTENLVDLDTCEFACFVRDQRVAKGSPRQIEKSLRKHEQSDDNVLFRLTRFNEVNLPFIELSSSHNSNKFSIRVNKISAESAFDIDKVLTNNYGLCSYSNQVVVPIRKL